MQDDDEQLPAGGVLGVLEVSGSRSRDAGPTPAARVRRCHGPDVGSIFPCSGSLSASVRWDRSTFPLSSRWLLDVDMADHAVEHVEAAAISIMHSNVLVGRQWAALQTNAQLRRVDRILLLPRRGVLITEALTSQN